MKRQRPPRVPSGGRHRSPAHVNIDRHAGPAAQQGSPAPPHATHVVPSHVVAIGSSHDLPAQQGSPLPPQAWQVPVGPPTQMAVDPGQVPSRQQAPPGVLPQSMASQTSLPKHRRPSAHRPAQHASPRRPQRCASRGPPSAAGASGPNASEDRTLASTGDSANASGAVEASPSTHASSRGGSTPRRGDRSTRQPLLAAASSVIRQGRAIPRTRSSIVVRSCE